MHLIWKERCAVHDPWAPYREGSELPYEDWEFYERDRIRPHHDWSSLVLVRVFPNGTFSRGYSRPEDLPPYLGHVLVLDTGKPLPRFPKMPGGKKRPGHTPRITALDETEEEAGLRVSPFALLYINSEWRQKSHFPHWSCLYLAHIEEADVPWMNDGHPGNEGEIPSYWTNKQFEQLRRQKGFFPPHESRLLAAGLIEPLD